MGTAVTPLVKSLNLLKLKITKTVVQDQIKTPFGTVTPPEGKRLMIITLAGVADRDYSPAGLVPGAFLVVYKNGSEYSSTASGAVSWFGDLWVTGEYKVSSGTDIEKGPIELRVAAALPPGAEKFTLCIPTPLPETPVPSTPAN
jgi:hypothetical protein